MGFAVPFFKIATVAWTGRRMSTTLGNTTMPKNTYPPKNKYDAAVLAAERDTLAEVFGHASSVQTTFGNNAEEDHARWHIKDEIIEYAFTQYFLKQGLRTFPVEGPKATMAVMKQLHDRHTFQHVQEDSMAEKQKDMLWDH
jgi:hypothetical protein